MSKATPRLSRHMDNPPDDRPRPLLRRYRFAVLCTGIACLTLVTFLPSLKNGFVNRDDPAYVMDNRDIRGFTSQHLTKIFSSTYLCHYLPVTMLSYMTDFRLFGLDPRGYHCTSLFLHILNCLLVFALFYRLSGRYFVGAVTALLFAVHPMRVEAVAWIAERKEVLSACFYFLSLLMYLRYRKKGSALFYILCLVSLLASLLSKTMSVSQPLVLILIDYLTGRKIDKKSLIEKIPFFTLSAIFSVIALFSAAEAIKEYSHYTLLQRALMPAWSIVFYLIKSIIPLHLSASYFLPDFPEKGMNLELALSVLAVAGIVVIVWRYSHVSKKTLFGSLFFFITLLPVLQIVNSGGLVLVADRYTYVPMLGVCFMIAAGLSYVIREKVDKNAVAKTAVYGVLAIGMTAFTFLTWQRCGVWNDSLTLWNDIIDHSPAAAQAYDGRAGAYRDRGEYRNAIADFNKALELKPDFAGAYFGRGYINCAFLGKIDPAIDDLKRAVSLIPDFPDAWNTLGIAYGMKGSSDLAMTGFDRAIALKPDFAEAYVNRGLARMNCYRDVERALHDLGKAVGLDPFFAKAYQLRGAVRKVKGDLDGSKADFERARVLNLQDPAFPGRGGSK